jgi:hypothetical protein
MVIVFRFAVKNIKIATRGLSAGNEFFAACRQFCLKPSEEGRLALQDIFNLEPCDFER